MSNNAIDSGGEGRSPLEKSSPFIISILTRELFAYNLVLTILLAVLLVFNLFSAQPALTPTALFIYSLITFVLAGTYLLRMRLRVGSEPITQVAISFSVQVILVFTLASFLQDRANPYFYLVAFDGYIALHSISGKRVWALAFVASMLALTGLGYFLWGTGWSALWGNLLWYGLIIVAAELLHYQWHQRLRMDSLLGELQHAHRRLQDYTAQAEALIIAQERNRLAHEVHDTVGYTLAALNIQIELLARLPADQGEDRAQAAEQARLLIKAGQADVWRAVQALRPTALEDLSLPEAVAELVDNFERAQSIQVDWQILGEQQSLPPRHVLPLFRAAQEALTNIQRHAPGAQQVSVQLCYEPAAVTLTVQNDSPTIPLPSEAETDTEGGHGLRGLLERTEALGGAFHAAPDADGGFRLQISIPNSE